MADLYANVAISHPRVADIEVHESPSSLHLRVAGDKVTFDFHRYDPDLEAQAEAMDALAAAAARAAAWNREKAVEQAGGGSDA